MYNIYMTPEFAEGAMNISVLYFERPLLKLKDKLFPPSQKTLDKRIANYVDSYIAGATASIPIIWDAIQKGGNPSQQVKTADGGTEPLIIRAAKANKFFLFQALQAGGADLNAKDSKGDTALIAATRAGSLEISTFLIELGADVEAVTRKGQDALFIAEEGGHKLIAKALVARLAFNAKSADKADEAPKAATPAATVTANKPAM